MWLSLSYSTCGLYLRTLVMFPHSSSSFSPPLSWGRSVGISAEQKRPPQADVRNYKPEVQERRLPLTHLTGQTLLEIWTRHYMSVLKLTELPGTVWKLKLVWISDDVWKRLETSLSEIFVTPNSLFWSESSNSQVLKSTNEKSERQRTNESITILYSNSVTRGRSGCVGRHKTVKLLDRKNPTSDHWLCYERARRERVAFSKICFFIKFCWKWVFFFYFVKNTKRCWFLTDCKLISFVQTVQ